MKTTLRSLGLLLLYVVMVHDAQAQDVFSSGGSSSTPQDCEGARNEEQQRMAENNAELQKEAIDIENQYRKDMIACGNAPSANPCRQAAGQKKEASFRELNTKRSDEAARHDKATVDINVKLCQAKPTSQTQQPSNEPSTTLLRGGVTKNVGAAPPSNSGVFGDDYESGDDSDAPDNTAANQPTGDVAPPLVLLRDVLDTLAPHYDLTKPNEGARIIKDILLGMALGRITSGASGALKTLFGKAGKQVGQELGELGGKLKAPGGVSEPSLGSEVPPSAGSQNPLTGGASEVAGTEPIAPSWGNPAQPPSSGGAPLVPQNSWTNPPPGVTPPKFLSSTPRRAFPQERTNSCALACTKMVADTVTRRSLPESFYQQLARGGGTPGGYFPKPNYDPLSGTRVGEIPKLLDFAGVKNSGVVQSTIDEVASRTANGYPAIVGIKSAAQGHALVVDAVVGNPGSRSLFVRDPLNLKLLDQTSRQFLTNAGFTNHGVMAEQEFLSQFEGRAIFTDPR